MGRHTLLTLLPALLLFGCERPARPAAGPNPHANLACTECHEGGLADGSMAAVPSKACTRSGCHSPDLPDKVTLATVTFTHRHHGRSGDVAIGCAGCHTHTSGSQPIPADGNTCGLCHQKELSAGRGSDCRFCHQSPDHTGMTSQGLAIPHQGLPWIEGGCLRCHYEVAKPVHNVSLERCRACHADVTIAAKAGIGEDLHPSHTGVACVACHEADSHRIEAMSSAVDMVCSDCHAQVHGITVKGGPLSSPSCDACHATAHRAQQRVLLGITPYGGGEAMPAPHFMDGLTCRSCHRAQDGGRASAQACVACHQPQFARVLGWWTEGIRQRMGLVGRYLAGADSAVAGRGPRDPAVEAVTRARDQLDLIRRGGGVHNIPLTHQLFQDALAEATQAYRDVGREPPSPPSLGMVPRRGICSFCHYELPGPNFSESMPDAFHRRVLGIVDQ